MVTAGQTSATATGVLCPAPDVPGQETVHLCWDSVAGTPLRTAVLGPHGSVAVTFVVLASNRSVHTLIAGAQLSQAATTRALLGR